MLLTKVFLEVLACPVVSHLVSPRGVLGLFVLTLSLGRGSGGLGAGIGGGYDRAFACG